MSLDVLAIAAHPDDVEQTCGGTLIRMAEAGYRTGVLDLTAGDMGTRGSPEIRVAESEVAAKHMLLQWRGNLHFPDARLENTLTARLTLAMKIRELQPRVVILPYWEARHPDHYRCGEMGFEACFLAGLKKIDEYSGALPAAENPLCQPLRRRKAVLHRRHQRAIRAPHDRAAELRRRNTAPPAKATPSSPTKPKSATAWAPSPASTATRSGSSTASPSW